MKAIDAKKVSARSMGDPFMISLEAIYSFISNQAHLGFSNCLLSIVPEKLVEFSNDLKNNGYDVFYENLENTYIENNLHSRYSKYSKKFIQLEISW